MTILVYRDGVMASDSGCWSGDASHPWTRKLAVGPDGVLHGAAGHAGVCTSYLEWVITGYPGDGPIPRGNKDYSDLIVLRAYKWGCDALTWCGVEQFPGAPYMAIGVSSPCAFGALHMGATAEQAVAACIAHGMNANGPVRSIRLPDL